MYISTLSHCITTDKMFTDYGSGTCMPVYSNFKALWYPFTLVFVEISLVTLTTMAHIGYNKASCIKLSLQSLYSVSLMKGH